MISDWQVKEILDLIGKIVGRHARRRSAGVTVGEGALLACLDAKGSVGAGELCEISGLGSGRIANLLKSTEAKGYVTRRRDATDKRKVWVDLTPSGREENARRKTEIFSKCRAALEKLGEEDTENILRILKKVTEYEE